MKYGIVQSQRIEVLQKRLRVSGDIIYHQFKGVCPLNNPIKHDFLSLILFESVKGKHMIDGINYEIGNHQLHLVFPGQAHHWDYKNESYIYQLFISKEVYKRLEGLLMFPIPIYKNKPIIEFDKQSFKKMLHEFKDVGYELNNESPVASELVFSKLKIITQTISLEFYKNINYLSSYKNHPALIDFMILLSKHYKSQRKKQFYADKLGINASYLNSLCRKYFEHTAFDVIQYFVIEKIKCELLLTDHKLKDIGFDFGFFNYGHFAGFVKKYTGSTPKKLREEIKIG